MGFAGSPILWATTGYSPFGFGLEDLIRVPDPFSSNIVAVLAANLELVTFRLGLVLVLEQITSRPTSMCRWRFRCGHGFRGSVRSIILRQGLAVFPSP